MNKALKLTVLLSVLVLASCSKSPKDRMVTLCEKNEEGAEDRKGCICTAEKLETKISEEKYEKLVTALEKDADKNDGDKNSAKTINEAMDQETAMAFMGAAKECANVTQSGQPATQPSAQ